MSARIISTCIALVAVLPALGYGASFDCRKATTSAEKLVCSSNEARILDVQLYETYQRVLRLSANEDAIRKQQLRWLNESRNTCKTVDCITGVYKSRISELTKEIHYSECEGDHGELTGTSLMIGYCNARGKKETENTIADLVSLISSRYTADQITRFKALQSDWKKNVQCNCFQEVGVGSGPGWSRGLLDCEIRETDQRLLEIREIAAGLQNLEYGRTGLKSCAEIRAKEEANPEYQMIQAITKNDIAGVKILLKEGIPIPRGDYSYTPIDIAVRNNNIEMLSFLLGNGANPDEDIVAMRAALNTCNMKMVSLLVDHGYKVKGNPSYYGPYDPLPWAALHGCTGIVEYLVSKGADIKVSKPLRHAVMYCHVETVKYLLIKGHDPDATDMGERTPLWFAAINAVNYPDKRDACKAVITDLLQAGANPDQAFIVPTENPSLKLPRDDEEIMKLLRNKSENKQ
jgi:uncharacterized protein/ankyrin repeat protein